MTLTLLYTLQRSLLFFLGEDKNHGIPVRHGNIIPCNRGKVDYINIVSERHMCAVYTKITSRSLYQTMRAYLFIFAEICVLQSDKCSFRINYLKKI